MSSRDDTATAVQTETETQTDTEVHVDDLDDVIEIAARLDLEDDDQLSLREVEEVAAELDIDPEHVREATQQLERERARERAQAVEAAGLRQRVLKGVAAAVTVALLGLAALTGVGHAGLNSRFADVETRRAQVVNVLERQAVIQKRYEGLELDRDREAEIIGAENRVRVERKRYDEAAAEYNRYASGLSGSIAQRLLSHPARVKLSGEPAAFGP